MSFFLEDEKDTKMDFPLEPTERSAALVTP
jgi:hypothetical protein